MKVSIGRPIIIQAKPLATAMPTYTKEALLRVIAPSPNSAEPNNQAAAGTGTWETLKTLNAFVDEHERPTTVHVDAA